MNQKLLVVDDSVTFRRHMRGSLEEVGYNVVEAGDGIEGIAQLEAHDDIAGMLLDMNMPNMTGLEMLDELANSTRLTDVPFVVITTEGSPELVAQARRLGARGWLIKPCDSDLVRRVVERLLEPVA